MQQALIKQETIVSTTQKAHISVQVRFYILYYLFLILYFCVLKLYIACIILCGFV